MECCAITNYTRKKAVVMSSRHDVSIIKGSKSHVIRLYLVPLPKGAATEQEFGSLRFLESLYGDVTGHDDKSYSGALLKGKRKAIDYGRARRKQARTYKLYQLTSYKHLQEPTEPFGWGDRLPSAVIASFVQPRLLLYQDHHAFNHAPLRMLINS